MQAMEIRSRRLRLEPSVPTDAISGLSRTMSTADPDEPVHAESSAERIGPGHAAKAMRLGAWARATPHPAS